MKERNNDMLTKTKRILALILCPILLLGLLAACGGGKEVKPILPEVKKALNIDSAKQKQINKMFEAFDSAYETLAKSKPVTDEAFRSYAEAISEAHDKYFDTIFDDDFNINKMIDSAETPEEEETFKAISRNIGDIIGARSDMASAYNNKSDEAYAEAAVNLVGAYGMLFYGEPYYTDDDLDRIG